MHDAADSGNPPDEAGRTDHVAAPEVQPQAPLVSGQSPAPPGTGPSPAVWIGGIAVIALPIFEVIGVASALSGCNSFVAMDVLLIAVTFAFLACGVTALILASSFGASQPDRSMARKLGIAAIVLAVVSVPINGFVVLLSGFCATG
jgi:hypothetical protein